MTVVIDASVAVKWFILDSDAERDLAQATALLRSLRAGEMAALQPPHWIAETLAVVARIRPRRTDAAITILGSVAAAIDPGAAVYKRAAEIAKSTKTHLFDALYHAVALERGATLVTADERYFDKAAGLGSITMLADWAA